MALNVEPRPAAVSSRELTTDGAARGFTWSEPQLSGGFELLPDRARPRVVPAASAIVAAVLDAAVSTQLEALASSDEARSRALAMAAFCALLFRYSDEHDIGVAAADAATKVALRCRISGEEPFSQLFERICVQTAAAFAPRPAARARPVGSSEPLRNSGRELFTILITVVAADDVSAACDALESKRVSPAASGTLHDIHLRVVRSNAAWRVSIEYRNALYDDTTAARLLAGYCRLLRAVAADATQAIGEITLLSDADHHELVVSANQTARPYRLSGTFADLIFEQAARTPATIAIICGDTTQTFAQVAAAARQLARDIASQGCPPGSHVGIFLERCADMVVAMAAVAAAGCAYVPLDPAYPSERLAFIAADAELTAVITHSTLADHPAIADLPCIFVDTLTQRRHAGGHWSAGRAAPAGVAYTIYTSGSTGQPKGVQIHHHAVLNFLFAMRERPGLAEHDTLVAVTTIAFDIAGLELLLPLVTGARLVIAKEQQVSDGGALLQLLQHSNATIVQATPVTWQLLISAGWAGDPAITVLCGGEALSRPLAEQLLDRATAVWNMYGPTETTIWSAVQRVTRGTGPVPIGPPIANTQFYVLDRAGRLAPPGAPGELYIGGHGVALGYLKRPELTRERFVADVFSGLRNARLYRTGDLVRARSGGALEFLGRIDHQIKIRGFRIELDEIAATLLRQSGVADAVVVAASDAAGSPQIRAFVELHAADDDRDLVPIRLRAQLAQSLPAYMLPAHIVVLEHLPRTPNGKIDRRALPLSLAHFPRAPVELPQSVTEHVVAKIAGELLGSRAGVGRSDDLFALGLHSLLVVRMIARIINELGVEVAVRTVFAARTVAAIALHVDQQSAGLAGRAVTAVQALEIYNPDAAGAPFVYFHNDDVAHGMYCRRLAAAIGTERPVFAIAPYGSAGLPILTSIEAMARDQLTALKHVQRHGPYRLGGFCSGGLVAFELARLLRAQGDAVAELVVINAYGPLRRAFPGSDALIRTIGLNPALHSLVREKLCLNIARWLACIDKGPAAMRRFVRERFVTAAKLRQREQQFTTEHPYNVQQVQGSVQTEAGMARIVADLTYHPECYAGRMTLVWSTAEPTLLGDPLRDDPTMGWSAVAQSVEIVSIDGGHDSPVQERVDELGALLAERLATQNLTPHRRESSGRSC